MIFCNVILLIRNVFLSSVCWRKLTTGAHRCAKMKAKNRIPPIFDMKEIRNSIAKTSWWKSMQKSRLSILVKCKFPQINHTFWQFIGLRNIPFPEYPDQCLLILRKVKMIILCDAKQRTRSMWKNLRLKPVLSVSTDCCVRWSKKASRKKWEAGRWGKILSLRWPIFTMPTSTRR